MTMSELNLIRARRIDDVLGTYRDRLGCLREVNHYADLSSLLTDVYHFCDAHGVNLSSAQNHAYLNYLREKEQCSTTKPG